MRTARELVRVLDATTFPKRSYPTLSSPIIQTNIPVTTTDTASATIYRATSLNPLELRLLSRITGTINSDANTVSAAEPQKKISA
jgi:hypothetical protein